ncbi:MAG: tetratricopeptide repeat protein [Sulfuricurvum sp.]|nr:tetratricopeptide repeat protein [Sulfuricurvum sp.]
MSKKIIFIIAIAFISIFLYANDVDSASNKITRSDEFWRLYTDALRGEKNAQFEVGVMYERGIGVNLNQFEAAKWYEKAAMQGHMDAQYNMGIMYASGRGVEQNDRFAMMWLASSAKQGDKDSRKLLLTLVDGKINPDIKTIVVNNTPKIEGSYVKPVRFETKHEASVCGSPSTSNCKVLKEKQTYTSKSKQGNYYKISGVVTGHKWEDYEGEGFIDISMVELK